MQFLAKIFSKGTYWYINVSKEIVIALIFLSLPIFYPQTAHAGLFSFMSSVTTGQVAAKTIDTQNIENSQNMTVLKAAVNANPILKNENKDIILASGDALHAEIGPSGTISDIHDPINTQISLYVVRSGDSLSQIAEMFDVSVNTILWANDLTKNSKITKGQTLLILPISGIKYTVKKGDTIKDIVTKYKADLEEVLLDNDLSINSTLKEGDIVMIPDVEPTAVVSVTPTLAPTKSKSNYKSYFIRPIVGGHKSQGIHGNNGVDLAAPVGTPIYAAASGTIIASMTNGAWHGGYGNYVVISHPNGTKTLYAHLLTSFVSVGDSVDKGQQIAKIGMTGKTTGPHVHFEIRGAVNPF